MSETTEPSAVALRVAAGVWTTVSHGRASPCHIAAIIEEETAIGEIVAFLEEIDALRSPVSSADLSELRQRAAQLLERLD